MRQRAAADVLAAVLRAARQRRDRLAGIQEPGRVERRLHGEERGALGGRELHAHGVELLDPDPVLAGDGTAESHAELEDLDAEVLGALPLAFLVGVEEDERVEVAVAGVKYV